MRSTYEERLSEQTEIERRLRQGTDKIVSPPKFALVAKVLWPNNTAAHLATIGSSHERTAARWLSGESDPPIAVVLAINREIFGRG